MYSHRPDPSLAFRSGTEEAFTRLCVQVRTRRTLCHRAIFVFGPPWDLPTLATTKLLRPREGQRKTINSIGTKGAPVNVRWLFKRLRALAAHLQWLHPASRECDELKNNSLCTLHSILHRGSNFRLREERLCFPGSSEGDKGGVRSYLPTT